MTVPNDLRVEIVGHPVIDPTEQGLAEAIARVRCPDCTGQVHLDAAAELPTFRVIHDPTCPRWRKLYERAQAEERARAKRERKNKHKRKTARRTRRNNQ